MSRVMCEKYSRSAERQKLDVATLQTTLELMRLLEVHISYGLGNRVIQAHGVGASRRLLVVVHVNHPAACRACFVEFLYIFSPFGSLT